LKIDFTTICDTLFRQYNFKKIFSKIHLKNQRFPDICPDICKKYKMGPPVCKKNIVELKRNLGV